MSPASMASEPGLLDLAKTTVERLRSLEPAAQVEVYLSRGREASIEFKEGELDSVQESRHEGLGVRVILDGRQGFAYASGVGLGVAEQLFERARRHRPFVPSDPYRRLPRASELAPSQESPGLRQSLLDPEILARPLSERVEGLRAMEAKALSLDRRVSKALHSGYGESRGEVALASSEGLACREEGTHCSLGLALTAGEGSEMQVGSASESRRHQADLDAARIAADAVERTVALLDAKKLPSRRRAVLFDPWVAGEILDLLTSSLSADQVQRGKSMLQGRLGQPVASPAATFVDDPRLPRGAASSLFDDEGVPTRHKTMIEGGVLKDFFYDCYTAAREGRPSNGSGSRPSFRGLPRPGHSNFFLAPGSLSRDSLIGDTQDGVLVFEILGMHTANPVSGEFSVGISGVAIEGGRLTHGVKGAMISGNLLELLSRIDAAADDLRFFGSLGAPTFRVEGLTVA